MSEIFLCFLLALGVGLEVICRRRRRFKRYVNAQKILAERGAFSD